MHHSLFTPLWPQVLAGQPKALARALSLVENEVEGWQAFLQSLPPTQVPVLGITGPPGAGKSTLTDALIQYWVGAGKKVGVLCIDPSSPFHLGALLGDRIRMSRWYSHPQVFIRSLASRGSLGGLHPQILPLADVMKAAGFNLVIIETVGVGQSEVDIAGLANCTVVVLVPEAGDDIQTMKAGLMEIADLFVVNKADRPEADRFVHHLHLKMMPRHPQVGAAEKPILKTVAHLGEGMAPLATAIDQHLCRHAQSPRYYWMLARQAWRLLQHARMQPFSEQLLLQAVTAAASQPGFQLYRFVEQWAAKQQ